MRLFLALAALLPFAAPVFAQATNLTDPDAIAAECGGSQAAGELLFDSCAACHSLTVDAAEAYSGPHLEGIVGRQIASVPGFPYSAGMQLMNATGTTWEREALHAFLANPQASDAHPVVADEQERRDIMTYMRIATLPKPPAPGELEISDEVFAMVGDVAYGEYLASECAGCHQQGSASIPNLNGYDRRYFITAMHEYRARSRENETMRNIAARLSNEEIAALAAFYTDAETQ